MSLQDKVVFVGVGQCGGNFAHELESLGLNAFYVNTSLEDLDTIETNNENKYHIKGTKGMAKDRVLAMEVITSNNNAENIAYSIRDRYAMCDIVFFIYSLSGGTGGTMGNIIAATTADLFPDKTINVVVIKGKSSEDVGLQANSIESLSQLKSMQKDGLITQIHILDNDSREDVLSINKDFAVCLNRFISFKEISKNGNLDEHEREDILMTSGMGVILEFSNDDFGNGLAQACDSSVYADWVKNPKFHGLILNRKQDKVVNREVIKDLLGAATFTHSSTWESDSNVLMAVGMDFNDNIINQMKINAQEQLEKKKRIEEESKKESLQEVEFDTTSIIDRGRKRTSNQSISTTPRRGEKRASSLIDKYRNIK